MASSASSSPQSAALRHAESKENLTTRPSPHGRGVDSRRRHGGPGGPPVATPGECRGGRRARMCEVGRLRPAADHDCDAAVLRAIQWRRGPCSVASVEPVR